MALFHDDMAMARDLLEPGHRDVYDSFNDLDTEMHFFGEHPVDSLDTLFGTGFDEAAFHPLAFDQPAASTAPTSLSAPHDVAPVEETFPQFYYHPEPAATAAPARVQQPVQQQRETASATQTHGSSVSADSSFNNSLHLQQQPQPQLQAQRHQAQVAQQQQPQQQQQQQQQQRFQAAPAPARPPLTKTASNGSLESTSDHSDFGASAEHLNRMDESQLRKEEELVERETKSARHKHRRGVVCPRCKVNQRLKQIRRLLTKREKDGGARRRPVVSLAAQAAAKKRRRVRRPAEPSTPTASAALELRAPSIQPAVQPLANPYPYFPQPVEQPKQQLVLA